MHVKYVPMLHTYKVNILKLIYLNFYDFLGTLNELKPVIGKLEIYLLALSIIYGCKIKRRLMELNLFY